MVDNRTDAGFTIVEVVVTLIIMSLFLTLFFQLFFTSESQRVAVMQRAAANDIAQSNLRKITAKSQISTINASAVCDGTTNGSGNKNNGILYKSLGANSGSTIITEPDGDATTTEWTTNNANIPAKESLSKTNLPVSTTQTLIVAYPRGCNALMPAKIISIVSYGSESVVHAGYVN